MNKQDISDIRRHFKVDSELLKINEIYNVYIRKETSEIFYEESRPFAFLELEQQELFLANFKKVLTGKLDIKLFEVKFQQPEEGRDRTYATTVVRRPVHGRDGRLDGADATDCAEDGSRRAVRKRYRRHVHPGTVLQDDKTAGGRDRSG